MSHGLWDRYVVDDHVDHAAWLRARATGELVGDCVCGGYLQPGESYTVGHTEWYETRCVTCGRETAAPGGRILRRSSRHAEQPSGWWAQRIEAMNRD